MKALFICKASTHTGLGHLIRSRTLAGQLHRQVKDLEVALVVIGEPLVNRLLNNVDFPYTVLNTEDEMALPEPVDLLFWDMLEASPAFFGAMKASATLNISISPIFNQMSQIDILFNRTRYHNLSGEALPPVVYAGLDYAIIQDDCLRIRTATYEDNLELTHFPIAISMGGGDAANQTLLFLESLKKCKVPATFWVMLGEGYKHSYDALINTIKTDTHHEIILAKTNRSMWQILKNCILAIVPGGITTYEAAYAGLPTLNLFPANGNSFLVRELEEAGACINAGEVTPANLAALNTSIETLYKNRTELLKMHLNAKGLIDRKSALRILEKCKIHLKKSVLSDQNR